MAASLPEPENLWGSFKSKGMDAWSHNWSLATGKRRVYESWPRLDPAKGNGEELVLLSENLRRSALQVRFGKANKNSTPKIRAVMDGNMHHPGCVVFSLEDRPYLIPVLVPTMWLGSENDVEAYVALPITVLAEALKSSYEVNGNLAIAMEAVLTYIDRSFSGRKVHKMFHKGNGLKEVIAPEFRAFYFSAERGWDTDHFAACKELKLEAMRSDLTPRSIALQSGEEVLKVIKLMPGGMHVAGRELLAVTFEVSTYMQVACSRPVELSPKLVAFKNPIHDLIRVGSFVPFDDYSDPYGGCAVEQNYPNTVTLIYAWATSLLGAEKERYDKFQAGGWVEPKRRSMIIS